jgi:hypothetical protein
VRAPIGPLRPAPPHKVEQHAVPLWRRDGERRVAPWTPPLLQPGGHGDRFPVPSRPYTLIKHEPNLKHPYLARQMSEEFSSRVAESTRLILS